MVFQIGVEPIKTKAFKASGCATLPFCHWNIWYALRESNPFTLSCLVFKCMLLTARMLHHVEPRKSACMVGDLRFELRKTTAFETADCTGFVIWSIAQIGRLPRIRTEKPLVLSERGIPIPFNNPVIFLKTDYGNLDKENVNFLTYRQANLRLYDLHLK